MKLTDAKLKALKEPGKHFDGGGLYIDITKAGGAYWRLKYRHGGKEKLLALGVYPAVGLRDARDKATDAKRLLQDGQDPGALRKAEKVRGALESVNTLEAVTNAWLAHQTDRWEAQTEGAIRASLVANVFPALGDRALASIKPSEVMACIKVIEARGAGELASRVLQRVKAIYRWAVTHERIEVNPMVDLVPGEILKPRDVTHRLMLPETELANFYRKLDLYDGDPTTVHALRLLVLTVTRPGELRGARWAEFDLEEALWTIPAERMKMRNEHKVPLPRQALEVLRSIQPLTGDGELVFPSPSYRSKPLSENTLNSAMARMGYKGIATAHGFRALFSTVANEHDKDADVIERQLAHIERNKVRAAYHRSAYTAERAKLMQWWADHLDTKRKGAAIIPIGKRKA
jgi:integrase